MKQLKDINRYKKPAAKKIFKNYKVEDRKNFYEEVTITTNEKGYLINHQRNIIKNYKVEDRKKFYESLKNLANKKIIKPIPTLRKRKNEKKSIPKTEKSTTKDGPTNQEHVEDFTPVEQETALDGYLKTYRIHGKPYKTDRLIFKDLAYLPPEDIAELGLDELTFIREIKQKVIDLINKQKKPIKLKFTFVCKFVKIDFGNSNLFSKIIESCRTIFS